MHATPSDINRKNFKHFRSIKLKGDNKDGSLSTAREKKYEIFLEFQLN